MKIVLILISVILSVSAEALSGYTPEVRGAFLHTPDPRLMRTHKVDGEVTIYFNDTRRFTKSKERVEKHSDVLTVMEKSRSALFTHSTFGAEIEYGFNDLEPKNTDSIVLSGKTGFPSPAENVWLFEREDGEIPLYFAHPEKEFAPHGKDSSGLFVPLTPLNTDVSLFPLLQLSVYPRLIALYYVDPVVAIREYNRLGSSSDTLSEQSAEIAKLTGKVARFTGFTFNVALVDSLIALDSTNLLAYCKMAEYLIGHNELDSAELYLEKATEHCDTRDYLYFETKALLAKRKDQFETAIQSYQKALEITETFSGHSFEVISEEYREHIKKLEGKQYSKENSSGFLCCVP